MSISIAPEFSSVYELPAVPVHNGPVARCNSETGKALTQSKQVLAWDVGRNFNILVAQNKRAGLGVKYNLASPTVGHLESERAICELECDVAAIDREGEVLDNIVCEVASPRNLIAFVEGVVNFEGKVLPGVGLDLEKKRLENWAFCIAVEGFGASKVEPKPNPRDGGICFDHVIGAEA